MAMTAAFPGIDIVHIPSFAEQLELPGSTFHDVFSALELRIAATKPQRTAHLAGRWAAKEAFIKAWSNSRYATAPTVRAEDVVWSQIQVTPDKWGRTVIVLTGELAAQVPRTNIPVSISHDGDYATAMCVF